MKAVCNEVPFEPPHDKTNKIICVPSEDSYQPGHPPSLIRVFAVHSVGSFLHEDAQADLGLRWVHMPFCWFCHEVARLVSGRIR